MQMVQKKQLDAEAKGKGLGFGIILFVLILQIVSRYLPNPLAVFVADDWANWARSSFYDSHWDALQTGLQDPNRPLSMAVVEVVFRIFGNQPVYWTILSVMANSFLLFCLMRMAWGLTGRKGVAVVAGVLFALFPNLTETYHWSTQILNEVTCALLFYGLSGWMWIDHVRCGGGWRLVISVLAYLVALFSYEAGVLLPAAYFFLLPWRASSVKSIFRLSPFGLVMLGYVAWRVTDAFGMNHSWHYPPHMEAGISIGGIIWNIQQLIQWWAGDNLFGSMLNGLQSFATLPSWIRRGLVAVNVLSVVIAGWFLRGAQQREAGHHSKFTSIQVIMFSTTWICAAVSVPIMSYTAPRLNVLPALGIGLLGAYLLARWPVKIWGPWLMIPAVLAMTSNQGTSESYRQAGELNHRLFTHLTQSIDEWSQKEALLLDTQMIRQRLTTGLLSPASLDQSVWAEYRNALLLRGFVTRGMAQLILQNPTPPILVLHDVENGTRTEGEFLIWHERYNPGQPKKIGLQQIFVVDASLVGRVN